MTDKGTSLRSTVLDILLRQEKGGEKLDNIINNALESPAHKDIKDRAFIKKLSEGTVERRITLDHVIDRFSNVKSSKMKPVVRNVLRMGVYQMLFMDSVPAHAICNESVKLVKRRNMGGLSGFVNAVLRSVEREGFDINSIEEADIRYSCPRWIYDKFREQFGEDKAAFILESSLKRRPVYIRTNLSKIRPDALKIQLEKEGIELKPAADRDYAFSIGDFGDLRELKAFKEGLFSVQDVSSMSIGDEIREILWKEKPEGFRILDICAAPGGKSCHAAETLEVYIKHEFPDRLQEKRQDFSVISRDISEKKTGLIGENRERLGLGLIKTTVFNATESSIPEDEIGKTDLLIADLPCSGLGVMGRKNDLKYRVQPEDILSLRNLQRDILINADKYLKDSGHLIFSVCTIDREETVEQDIWIRETLKYKKLKDRLFIPGEEGDGFYYSVYIKQLT